MAQTKIETISYAGWPNCIRLSNGGVELIVTTDVGPRVIRYGFIGRRNMFAELPDQLGKSGESWWAMRGGHRLWAAPEIQPDTYSLDNQPVQATLKDSAVTLQQPVESETSLRKEITVELGAGSRVKVTHRIENCGTRSRKFAPWALTAMAPGGVGIAAFPPRGCHGDCLLPTNPLVMWAYTNFTDNRWQVTNCYLLLKQDASKPDPQKAGLFNAATCAAYLLGTDLFVKRSQADPNLQYPDYNCSFEMFSNGDFLELETLGPLVDLPPGASTTHVEHWSLHGHVVVPALTEPEIDRAILPFFRHPV